MKKILIVYATYGTGHKSIAKYIETYFKEKNPDYEIMCIDLLIYSVPILGEITQKASNKMILSKNPYIWRIAYKLYDNKISVKSTDKIMLTLFKNKKLKHLIQSFNPDLTISTHFWASSLISSYNKKQYINSKLMTIVTDYQSHEFWMANYKNEDAIIVSDKDVKKSFVKNGIPKNKIYTYGIPISGAFSKDNNNKMEMYAKYKINRNFPIILFFGGGGLGAKSSIPYAKALFKLHLNVNIIFVSGMSKDLRQKIKSLAKEYDVKNINVLGFVNNVPDLMHISDFVITKPGGITVTECINEKKPMVLIGKKGGNEQGNTKYVIKHNFGIDTSSTRVFKKEVTKLVKYPNYLQKFENKLNKNQKNNTINKLYKLSNQLLKK